MRDFSVEEGLLKTMQKLAKRDRVTYDALIGKMQEIRDCSDINHYKNLRSPLQRFKRVHVRGPFVLTFSYDASANKVHFYDFDHHDNVYQ